MKFTIKNTQLQTGQPPAAVVRVLEYLNKLPDGELLTYRELQAMMNISRSGLINVKAHPPVADYWTMALVDSKYRVLFGNPRTIAAYNKEFKT